MDFDISKARSPGLLRRLAAMTYDSVLLFAMLLLAVAVVVMPYQGLTGQPFPQHGWIYRLHQIYLLCVIVGFYSFFWIRGGQTLGMRAWRFRLVRDDGRKLTLTGALKRLTWALLTLVPAGIGLLWMLVDSERLSLYDRLSNTRLVMLKQGS